jgi:hypothetical protein
MSVNIAGPALRAPFDAIKGDPVVVATIVNVAGASHITKM